ncbi:MAG: hypothetical protein ABRQ25_17590 [Clostridiaceae bacterium]
MKNNNIIEEYNKFYSDIDFERSQLFELLKDEYGCNYILYPGCSIHITPSFFFQHVIYIDKSAAAKEFFRNSEEIISFVNGNKKYNQQPYIEFLDNDYKEPLPLRENQYDLLISLYAEGVSSSCKKYLKPGGIILSNNHLKDVTEAMQDSSVVLTALIRKKGKKYMLFKGTEEELLKSAELTGTPKKNIVNWHHGIKYEDTECYYVLKKVR